MKLLESTACRIVEGHTECVASEIRTTLADVRIDLDEAIRELRPRLDSESPPWIRNLWASLRGIQSRIERI